MPTIQELEKEDVIMLADRCQRVAEAPSTYTKTVADEAFELKLEWVALAGVRPTSAKKDSANEAQMKSLHHRMAEFLAGIL